MVSIARTRLFSVFEIDEDDGGFIPDDNCEYKSQQYWERRFAREDTYDWLATFAMVREGLEHSLGFKISEASKPQKVLLVGCGNSTFSYDLHLAAPHWDLVSTDYSQNAVDHMRVKYPMLRYELQDMCNLTYPTAEFDLVLDKAAMDALVADEGSAWDPSESSIESVNATVQCSARVLKPSGKLVIITFQPTHFRRRYLQNAMKLGEYAWEDAMQVVPLDHPTNGNEYSIFTLTRKL